MGPLCVVARTALGIFFPLVSVAGVGRLPSATFRKARVVRSLSAYPLSVLLGRILGASAAVRYDVMCIKDLVKPVVVNEAYEMMWDRQAAFLVCRSVGKRQGGRK